MVIVLFRFAPLNDLPEHIKCSLNLTSFNSNLNLKLIFLSAIFFCSFALVFFEFIIY